MRSQCARSYSVLAALPLVAMFVFGVCRAEVQLKPDPRLTPGDTVTTDIHVVCQLGYAQQAREITETEKRQVFRLYGIGAQNARRYQIDHLISLALGGSNAVRNLWPQSLNTQPYNAYRKDELENKLRELVCAGDLPIRQAQVEISSDWIEAYKKYLGPPPNTAHKPAANAWPADAVVRDEPAQ